jgi:protein O-GlcNAc transferase
MNNVALPELVAQSTDEYVRIAVELAKDRGSLAELRATLRQRMKASALMDAKGYARDMEGVYRRMWGEFISRSAG